MTVSQTDITPINCRKARIRTEGLNNIIRIIKEISMAEMQQINTKVETITIAMLRAIKDKMTITPILLVIK